VNNQSKKFYRFVFHNKKIVLCIHTPNACGKFYDAS
jgi:hypothetical protein